MTATTTNQGEAMDLHFLNVADRIVISRAMASEAEADAFRLDLRSRAAKATGLKDEAEQLADEAKRRLTARDTYGAEVEDSIAAAEKAGWIVTIAPDNGVSCRRPAEDEG